MPKKSKPVRSASKVTRPTRRPTTAKVSSSATKVSASTKRSTAKVAKGGAPSSHDLAAYRRKRDFSATPEPAGVVKAKRKAELFFCVQKHLASRLHYDFRLEHEGVLLSWSVPKGPSLNAADKRLAVHVEDHPFDYGTFEGVIPSGYGAGVVVLWDKGRWIPEEDDVAAAIEKGEIKFSLEGVKLKGSWVLVRTKSAWSEKAGQETWLLIKHRDKWAGDIDVTEAAPQSVTSFGDFADVLRAHGVPPAWRRETPVKGGEGGARFAELIAEADAGSKKRKGETRKTKRVLAGASTADTATVGTTTAATTKVSTRAKKGARSKATLPASKARPRTTSASTSASTKNAKATGPSLGKTKKASAAGAARTAGALDVRAFGKRVPNLTNQQKVLYPATGFTKGSLVHYFVTLAPLILPHLAGRAVTLKRYPDGVDGKFFFEKHCATHRPDWVRTVVVPSDKPGGKTIEFCTIPDISTLAWVGNLAAIELHVPLALAKKPDVPRVMVFDLDPGPPADIALCAEVALRLRGLLREVGLECFAKHSGGKGIHLYVPLNTPGVTFDDTKTFSKAVATAMASQDPKHIVANMARADRPGKVYIDWAQNDRDKTTACVYTPRARDTQTVSWPLSWQAIEKGKLAPILADEALTRVGEGDAFSEVLTLKQKLPKHL